MSDPTRKEIEKVFENLSDKLNLLEIEGHSVSQYEEGMKDALGWVLGYYDKPDCSAGGSR